MDGAKALLEQSGYTDSDGDGFLDKDGKKVSLQIITYGRTGLPQTSQRCSPHCASSVWMSVLNAG